MHLKILNIIKYFWKIKIMKLIKYFLEILNLLILKIKNRKLMIRIINLFGLFK